MSEYQTKTGTVIHALAFADKQVDDALGLKELTFRVTDEGFTALEKLAAKNSMPLRAFIRHTLESALGIPIGMSSNLVMPPENSEEELQWPPIVEP